MKLHRCGWCATLFAPSLIQRAARKRRKKIYCSRDCHRLASYAIMRRWWRKHGKKYNAARRQKTSH